MYTVHIQKLILTQKHILEINVLFRLNLLLFDLMFSCLIL